MTHPCSRCFAMCLRSLSATILALLASSTCLASWAYVPQEVRMAEAQLVVVGEIAGLTDSVKKNGTEYEVGIIEPLQVLKGKAPDVIRLAWYKPNPNAPQLSTQLPVPKQGDKSIWVLTADEKLPVYWATYPTDRQPVSQLADIKKRLESVAKLRWSEPVGGMQLAVFVEGRDVRNSKVRINGKEVQALEQLACYTMMRNTTDKVIHWVDYPYDNPFSIEFKNPNGEPIDVKVGINAPRKPPIQSRNFRAVDPGRVQTMGYGFQLGSAVIPGDYTVKVAYKNGKGGKPFGIDSAWVGEISTPWVTVHVPKNAPAKK